MPKSPWIRRLRSILAGALTLALLSPTAAVAPAAARSAGEEADDHVPDELLVGFHDEVTSAQAEAVYQAEGAGKLERLHRVNVHRIRLNPRSLKALEQRLRTRPEVAFVELNRRVPVALTPSDPYFSSQWHHTKLRSAQAWDVTTGAPDVVIGILDSGVDPSHPDLAAKLVPGWNFYGNNANTSDVFGHGTRVAGTAAAIGDNGLGVAGVAMQSRIMPLRVSDATGYAYYSTIANALTWGVDQGARVMNISFSGVAASSSIRSAAQYVRKRGGVVVAAAGNCGCVEAGAENPEMISVSATTSSDALASWSSRGNHVDVAAPGASITTTSRGGGYSTVSGTSFASPITAGVVALMLAAQPGLSPDQVEQLLKANTDDLGASGWDPQYGHGRINAHRAVAAAAASATGPAPDAQAPTVMIQSPANGATVSGSVAVAVAASDNVGVTKVELWVDGSLTATDTSAPWAFTWDSTTKPNGSRTLAAKAYDAAGNVASVSTTVKVSNPISSSADTIAPSVRIGWVKKAGKTLTLTVQASDDVGVARVELHVNGKLHSTKTAAPYTFTTSLPAGTHSLQARAADAAGNIGTSAPITLRN